MITADQLETFRAKTRWKTKLGDIRFSAEDADRLFFTSDTHFNHANILGFCGRPFKDTKEHDEELVRRWNEKVSADDLVFHLGDVCFGNYEHNRDVLDRLNGNIYLILGNHDMRDVRTKYKDRFVGISMQALINVDGQQIILNHCPLACFPGSYRKKPVWQLYGHVHTSPYSEGVDVKRLIGNGALFPSQYDVGVDNNDFRPVSYRELQDIIQKRIDLNRQEGI